MHPELKFSTWSQFFLKLDSLIVTGLALDNLTKAKRLYYNFISAKYENLSSMTV